MSELTLTNLAEIDATKPAVLSPEEEEKVTQLAQRINLHDSMAASNYGADAQSRAARFSEGALSEVSGNDVDVIGELLVQMRSQIQDFDPDAKGFFRFIQSPKKRAIQLQAKYKSVSESLDKIRGELTGHQLILQKDIKVLDQLYDENLAHFQELNLYILAGQKAIVDARQGELKGLSEKAERTGAQEDALAVRDLSDKLNQLEKQIYDLETTRTICLQMAPQIRIIQNTNQETARSIQSSINNALPLWKNQMVLALGMQHSRDAINAQRAVADMTNKMLLAQSEKLKMNAVDAARTSERGIVDIETLRQTNENLLTTIDEVLQIQTEGREKRIAAETELQGIEAQLREHIVQYVQ